MFIPEQNGGKSKRQDCEDEDKAVSGRAERKIKDLDASRPVTVFKISFKYILVFSKFIFN